MNLMGLGCMNDPEWMHEMLDGMPLRPVRSLPGWSRPDVRLGRRRFRRVLAGGAMRLRRPRTGASEPNA